MDFMQRDSRRGFNFWLVVISLTLFSHSESIRQTDNRATKLHQQLSDFFIENSDDATKGVMVEFEDSPDQILGTFDFSSDEFQTEEEMHKAYRREMKLMRRESQGEVIGFLNTTSVNYKSFWISNQLYIPHATRELCENLGSFANVVNIREEQVFHLHLPLQEGPVFERDSSANANARITSIEWNIDRVNCSQAWPTTKGEGINIGLIDTGIRSTHQAFVMADGSKKVVAWKDAVNGQANPYDDQGHGTHCAGIASGTNGIGVAPASKLVVCKACDSSGSCTESCLTDCCQFMANQKPHIVSNSWGGPSGTGTYTSIINSWKAMGICGVFSCGNSGPACGTVGSPADYATVISVGSTTSSDSLSDFSSRGQCKSGMLGPTCCAPGSSITSSWVGSDSTYKTISGTSMAAPHVSGTCALMKAVNPAITFDEIKSVLSTATTLNGLADPKQTCGGTPFASKPNNMYGHGLIDAASAVKQALALKTKPNKISDAQKPQDTGAAHIDAKKPQDTGAVHTDAKKP